MLMNDIVGDDGTDMASSYTINRKITASDGLNRVQQFLQWSIHAPVPYMEDFECCPLATVIVGFCTFILITGAKESSRFNTVMTILNLTVLGFVVVSGFMSDTIQLDNLQPFFPHGFSGVGRAAGLVFFSYVRFLSFFPELWAAFFPRPSVIAIELILRLSPFSHCIVSLPFLAFVI
jgi:hypothetical protein